jgi:SAM-dependent methyltransferase
MIDQYFMELFERIPRQGPGSKEDTTRAFKAIKSSLKDRPYILDIGCGKGVQTIDLARLSGGHVIALDNHEPFLTELEANAIQAGLDNHVDVYEGDMMSLPFNPESFDLIWAEGSAFIMGLESALEYWHSFIKKDGFAVISDAVYLQDEIPEPVFEFFEEEYPGMLTLNEGIELLKDEEKYRLIDHFTLSKEAWTTHFYEHLKREIDLFRENELSKNLKAKPTLEYLESEIDLYNQFNDYFGYEFWILRKK